MKEVRLSVRIGAHDLAVKANTTRRLLSKGARVKIAVQFKGREIANPELGTSVIDDLLTQVADCSKIVNAPTLRGHILYAVLDPKVK